MQLLFLLILNVVYTFASNCNEAIELTNGLESPVASVGPDQWTHFKIDMGAITEALRVVVNTTTLNGNSLEVYLNFDSCANEATYLSKHTSALSGFYEVGVNSPDVARPGVWFVSVKGKSDLEEAVSFRVSPIIGFSACAKPDLTVCGKYVDYSVLDVHNHAVDAEVFSKFSTLEIGSKSCDEDIMNVLCKSHFPMCDASSGIAIKPCPNVCTKLHLDCPLSDHGSEQLTENVCNLASKPSLFGSGTNCFPKPKPAPPICRQVHFSCETPECYPTARPLLCPDADGTYIEQKEASTAWGVIGKIILTALLPTAFLIYSAIAERQSIEKELEKLANKEFQDNRARTSETRVNGSTPQWA